MRRAGPPGRRCAAAPLGWPPVTGPCCCARRGTSALRRAAGAALLPIWIRYKIAGPVALQWMQPLRCAAAVAMREGLQHLPGDLARLLVNDIRFIAVSPELGPQPIGGLVLPELGELPTELVGF